MRGCAARLPVVFRMTPGAVAVDAAAAVRLQAQGVEPPVTFETDDPLRIVAATLATVVGVDPENDAFFLPPPEVLASDPPLAEPNEWLLKTDAPLAAAHVQLEPERGLAAGVLLQDPNGTQYRVVAAKGGIVTIAPALESGLAAGTRLVRVARFAPFAAKTRNRQKHALYLGAKGALDIETAAVIEVEGGAAAADATWEYWGKPPRDAPPSDAAPRWREFERLSEAGRLLLWKPDGAIEPTDVGGRSNRWIRAIRGASAFGTAARVSRLRLLVNCQTSQSRWPGPLDQKMRATAKTPVLEGLATTAPLMMAKPFYPLGRVPRLFDAFYLGSKEIFAKPRAHVELEFKVDDTFSGPLAAAASATETSGIALVVGVGLDGKLHRLRVGSGPDVSFLPAEQPRDGSGRLLPLTTGLRPGAALTSGGRAAVTVAAGPDVWKWSEPITGADATGKWDPLGRPQAGAAATAAGANDPAGDTVLVKDASDAVVVYALFAGRLYRGNIDSPDWHAVAVPSTGTAADLTRVVPIVQPSALAAEPLEADGLVGVSATGELFLRKPGPVWERIAAAPRVDPAFYPLVIKTLATKTSATKIRCVTREKAADGTPGALVAFNLLDPAEVTRAAADLVGGALGFTMRSNALVIIGTATGPDRLTHPMQWDLASSLTLGAPRWMVVSAGHRLLSRRGLRPAPCCFRAIAATCA